MASSSRIYDLDLFKLYDYDIWKNTESRTGSLIFEVSGGHRGGGNDQLIHIGGGHVHGMNGNDTITSFATGLRAKFAYDWMPIKDAASQTSYYSDFVAELPSNFEISQEAHVHGGAGNDKINLAFLPNTYMGVQQSHHVYTDSGADTVNFIYTDNVVAGQVVTGRIQDLDYSRDKIQLEGQTINLKKLPSNVKLLKYKSSPSDDDPANDYGEQVWILIKTSGGGHLFYALGASRENEFHFLKESEIPNFDTLAEVKFSDPQNYVPYHHYKGKTYNIIDDIEDDDKKISGTSGKDVINAGTKENSVYGGDESDWIAGGGGDDRLYGGSSRDNIWGGDENDKVYGGLGNDALRGNNGDDYLYGGSDNDQLEGGDGDDRLYGGIGTNNLYGGAGDDYMRADNGTNTIKGGSGSDTVSYYGWKSKNGEVLTVDFSRKHKNGGFANNDGDYIDRDIENVSGSNGYGDRLTGDNRANVIKGYGGDDRLYGGGGDDRIYGGSGNDSLYGGAGDDYMRADNGTNTIKGGSGSDTVSYYGWKSKNGEVLTVDLSRKHKNGGFANNDGDYIDIDIENVSGSNGYGDRLTGDNRANVIKGYGGDDRLYGGGGDDLLKGYEDDDYLYGGSGTDKLYGDSGDDFLDAGASSSGWQLLRGGTGSDQYRVEKDNGKVSIREESRNGSGQNDVIIFNDTKLADWTITEDKNSSGEERLEFTLKSDSSTEIHVYDFDHIEHFKFSDGSDYTSADDLLV